MSKDHAPAAVAAVRSRAGREAISKEAGGRAAKRLIRHDNITAAMMVSDMAKSSFGPRGMDKMLIDPHEDVTITNDGTTIMRKMLVSHPVAKMMLQVAIATDDEVGDGTTAAVILVGALLEKAERMLDLGIHPTVVANGYYLAEKRAIAILREIAQSVPVLDRKWLVDVARTAIQSKLASSEAEHLAQLVATAICRVAEKRDTRYFVDPSNIAIQKYPGGALKDTRLVQGVVLAKEAVASSTGRRVEDARIAIISVPLQVEKTKFEAKVTVTNPAVLGKFAQEKARSLKALANKIKLAGANVVVSQKAIDEAAATYLGAAGVFAVRLAKEVDVANLVRATGARIVSGPNHLTPADLGFADVVEERKISESKETNRWVFVEGCRAAKAGTIVLRGGTERLVDEAERSIHDAVMVAKDLVEGPAVVAGGGATEEEVAFRIRRWAETLHGRRQLAAQAFAEALEAIPLALATSAGIDPIDATAILRSKHARGEKWFGIEAKHSKFSDMYGEKVLEPLTVKEQVLKSSTETACAIIRTDLVMPRYKDNPAVTAPHFTSGPR